jgi:hypothetical protein
MKMLSTIREEDLLLLQELSTTQVEVITIQVEDLLTDNHQTTKKKS